MSGEREYDQENGLFERRVRRREFLKLTGGLALSGSLLSACGGGEEGGPTDTAEEKAGGGVRDVEGAVTIAVVPKAIGFDFWEQVREGAQCAGSKLENVTVQWDGVTAETDVTGQVNLLQNFVTQGVDGLVYAATDAKALARVTQQALDAGIPVVNIDSGTDPQPKNVPVFATDNVAAAEQVPDLLAKFIGGKGGKIAFIPFQAGTLTNDQRAEGFKKGLKDHPELDLVAEQSSQSDFNTALRVTEDILTAHPDLDGIFAANEPGAVGAAEAVRNAGKAGEIVIVGWDAAPSEIKGVEDGVISALVVQNPFRMGWDGVNAMVKIVREDAQVESADTGVNFVTKDNIDDPEIKALLNPSCENPPPGVEA